MILRKTVLTTTFPLTHDYLLSFLFVEYPRLSLNHKNVHILYFYFIHISIYYYFF